MTQHTRTSTPRNRRRKPLKENARRIVRSMRIDETLDARILNLHQRSSGSGRGNLSETLYSLVSAGLEVIERKNKGNDAA